MESFFILVPLLIGVGILIRLAAGSMDHGRIQNYIESRGGKVLGSGWAPFGPGWFGKKSDRIYAVRYIDSGGNTHQAYCRTSAWSGVYFTEDRVIHHADRHAGKGESLEEENRRLREELERLKRERGEG